MSAKSTMCIVFHDEAVDAVFIDRSMLGTQIKFMERLPWNDEVFEAVASLMKSAGKTPSRVTLCVPRSSVIQRTLSYPAAAKDELDNMVQFEAARHIPLPEDDRLLGWTSADTPDEKQVVLNLVAARRADVRGWIEQFELAGVPIDEAVPFSSALSSRFSDVSTLLVMVDEEHLELCLYGQGILQDSLQVSRKSPGFSSQQVVSTIRRMVAKHKDWLGDEGICRILAGGAQPLIGGLKEELGTTFGLHVQPLELPETITIEEDAPLIDALLAASEDIDPALNLIEDKKRKVPISKRTLIISSLCIILAVELLAAYGFKSGSPWLQRQKVQEDIAEMRQMVRPIQEMRDKNRAFRKQLYQLEQFSKSRTSTMDMLKSVSEAMPEDTYLNHFACDGEKLTVKGLSKEPDRLPGLMMELPFVETLSTSDIGKKSGDYYEFNLSVSLGR